jgi:hypothetical protein
VSSVGDEQGGFLMWFESLANLSALRAIGDFRTDLQALNLSPGSDLGRTLRARDVHTHPVPSIRLGGTWSVAIQP